MSDGEVYTITDMPGGLLYIQDSITGGFGLYAVRVLNVELIQDKFNDNKSHYTVTRGDDRSSVYITRVGADGYFWFNCFSVLP